MTFRWNSGADAAIEKMVETDMQKRALSVEGAAKGIVPVDTGRLRSSISHVMDGSTAHIGSGVEYALEVENRSPYLVPALDAAKR